jgi:hypothetical protein
LWDALESCIREIDEYWPHKVVISNKDGPYSIVENLCSRFHLAAKQLLARHNSRSTLQVTDEYDLQDLFHALLQLFFDDVRAEECTPSYAGKCCRMDFLLKEHALVIETKMTRSGLSTKELTSQLIEDVARYAAHPGCRTLVCFVYDPENRVVNPVGLERDLSCTRNGMTVKALIFPKGA